MAGDTAAEVKLAIVAVLERMHKPVKRQVMGTTFLIHLPEPSQTVVELLETFGRDTAPKVLSAAAGCLKTFGEARRQGEAYKQAIEEKATRPKVSWPGL